MTARERYVKMSVQIQNSLKAEMILSEKVALKQLLKIEQKQLKSIKNTIQDLEKQMMEIVKSSQDLNSTYTKISSVIGVGAITSIKCIIETNNFTRFTDARKFNCHCGLAPFPYLS